jgi:hypothetical protein
MTFRGAMLANLALVASVTAAGCNTAPTTAVIEVQSDFDDEIESVRLEIRDEHDATSRSTASYSRTASKAFEMPFSFGVQQRSKSSAFVVVATAQASGRAAVTAKLRVRWSPGKTIHRRVFLYANCAGVSCEDGESCKPADRSCGRLPDPDDLGSSGAAPRDDGVEASGSSGRADVDAGSLAADGGSRSLSMDSKPTDSGDAGSAAGQGEAGASGAVSPPPVSGMSGAGRDAMAAGAGSGGMPASGGMGGAGTAAGSGGRAGGSGTGGSAGTTSGSAGITSGDAGRGSLQELEWAEVSHAGRAYSVHANKYGNGAITIDYVGASFTVTDLTGDESSGIASPGVFIGHVYAEGVDDENLPKRVSDLRGVSVDFNTNADAIDGDFRVLAGAWFSVNADGDTGFASGGTLEVWPYAKPGQTPEGSIQARALTFPGVAGAWDVWVGTYADRPAVVYVRTQAQTSLKVDLKPFIDDAAQRPNAILNTWYVTTVSASFDIYRGGAGLQLSVNELRVE